MSKLWIPLACLLCVLAAGCGGGSGAGSEVVVDTNLPPLDFTFRPPAEPMVFNVDLSSEAEFRGTGITSSVHFTWTASDWRQEEDGAWTCDVTFSKVKAAMRQGSSISMEPISEFDRMEGYTIRYRKDAEGFGPVSDPAEDSDFVAVFEQMQYGMGCLDIEIPEGEYRPGMSWEDAVGEDDINEMAEVMTDSIITSTYAADEEFKGRVCARIDYNGKIGLDGAIPNDEGSTKLKGSFEVKGKGYFDRAQGFYVRDEARIKIIMDRRQLDEKGKPQGNEFSMVQIVNLTVGYQG